MHRTKVFRALEILGVEPGICVHRPMYKSWAGNSLSHHLSFFLFLFFVVVVVVYLEREILSTYWVDMVINNKCYLSQVVISSQIVFSPFMPEGLRDLEFDTKTLFWRLF